MSNGNPTGLPLETQRICQLFERMNGQLADKRKNITTIVDIYNLFEDEQKAFRVIQRAVQNLPNRQRALLGELRALHETLEEDFVVVKTWQSKYKRERERFLTANLYQERHLEARPNFRILELKPKGKYIQFKISEKVQEFEFRVRQALVSFHQLIETHCSSTLPLPTVLSAPVQTEDITLTPYDSFIYEPKHSFDTLKIRFPIDLTTAPYPFDNYSPIFSHLPDQPYLPDKYPTDFFQNPRTRIPSRDYLINPDGDLKQNCLGYIKLFVEFAIQKGNLSEYPFAQYLPCVPVHMNEAPLDHPLNSIG